MSGPRILVYGADNFLGRRVVEALERGRWAEPIAAGSTRVAPRDASGPIHGIVNAAEGGVSAILRQAGAAAGAAAAEGPGVRLVHVSSMTVYGSVQHRVTETAAESRDLGAYAGAQIDAERIARTHGNAVILRPGCEYGPGCEVWSRRIAALLAAGRLGDLGAAGDGWCNLIYIDDLVAAILESLRRPELAGEVFNLAMPDPPTWNEYLTRFAIALRVVPVRRVTRRRLALERRILAPPLKALEMLARRLDPASVPRRPALTSSLLRLCAQRIVLDAGKAERVLGLRWTPLAEGLARTAATLALRDGTPA